MGELKSKNLAYEIAEILSDRIIKMAYKPGERLVESRIAREFEVSRGPIREAFHIMEQGGLLEINQRTLLYQPDASPVTV